MADSDKNSVPEIHSIGDEETLTEIDLGSFLSDKDSEEPLFDGCHSDIEKTEKSLEDELQSLYDDIMSTGPVTIVPKKLDDIAGGKASPQAKAPEVNIREKVNSPAVSPEANDSAKDDILSMIDALKSQTEKESGFDEILTGIESNEEIAPFVSDISKSGGLTSSAAADVVNLGPPAPSASPAPSPAPKAPSASAAPGEIDIHSDTFESELAELLGDTTPDTLSRQKPAVSAGQKNDFTVNIPEETLQENGFVVDLLPNDGQRTVGVVPDEIIEDDGKISRKDKKQAKREDLELSGKKYKGDIIRRVVLVISIIIILVSSGILAKTYLIEPYQYKKNESAISDSIDHEVTGTVDEVEKDKDDDTEYPSGMLAKYRQLFKVNDDLRGWISIPALEINLPIAQSSDNDYYLHRNIYKKWTNYGVPFFDYRIADLRNLPKNTVVYGHNMHYDDLIFGLVENYREPEGFKSAPVIECNTIYGDHVWFVYAAFITNSAPNQDNGYVFPYNFIDISEQKFSEYIQEIDKRKFYTTGVDINPSDKILTLSTCCYDFDGGRLVIVARLKRDGEPDTVDTSKVIVNSNPKYPQAWYNANKKTNPYANDPRW